MFVQCFRGDSGKGKAGIPALSDAITDGNGNVMRAVRRPHPPEQPFRLPDVDPGFIELFRMIFRIGREFEGIPRRQPDDLMVPVLPNRKSTRLNSSHVKISYAVFCLKKK